MKDCNNCGGSMKPIGNGAYKCPFCGNRWVDPNFAAQQTREAPTTVRATPVVESKSTGSAVFEQNINGVLEIECRAAGTGCAGSGFLIADGGYVVTNTHVVTHDSVPYNNITVHIAGEEMGATILALGDDRGGHGNGVDLALLKLDRMPRRAKIVKMADFSSVKVGESVYVIGNSLGYGTCITGGIVSDKSRNVNGKMLLMTDCAVNGGNSGGPIFNANGEAIGAIVSGITAAEGMNFAIPANTVIDFLRGNGVRVSTCGVSKYSTSAGKCPRCGSFTTDVQNNIRWCGVCDYEW